MKNAKKVEFYQFHEIDVGTYDPHYLTLHVFWVIDIKSLVGCKVSMSKTNRHFLLISLVIHIIHIININFLKFNLIFNFIKFS